MYAKRRTIPMEVSVWMDKDVSVRKTTASSGLMPDTPRQNVFLSRKFYSDMLNLSFNRYHKISRSDYSRSTFLKDQRHKAETTMPGLLPYIEQYKDEMEDDLSSSRNDQFISSTFQSFTARSIIKSESTLCEIKQPAKKNKKKKAFYRQQISLERINRLAQPKGQQMNSPKKDPQIDLPIKDHYFYSPIKDHNRSINLPPINIRDIYSNIDDISNENSFVSYEPKVTTADQRFRQLIHLFSEVHEPKSTKIQSVKNIIQSNLALQNNDKRRETTIDIPTIQTMEEENNPEILDDSFYSKTEVYLIDTCD